MKKLRYIIFLLLLTFLLVGNTGYVFAQTPDPITEDKVVIGQTFILKTDQELDGDLAIIGGTAILNEGSRVTGDIALIGGVLQVFGTIDGDIQALGGSVELEESAVVHGSLNNFSSTLRQADGAVIEGQQVSNLPFNFSLDGFPNFQAPSPNVTIRKATSFLGNVVWGILQILAMGALAMLILLLAPKPTERMATSLGKQPFVHWGIGLLSAFAIPAALVIMMITIILIPLGLIGFLIFGVMLTYGWIALGYEIGKRVLKNNAQNLSPAVEAGIGTLILTTIARLVALIPCIGWTLGAALALFGLGSVVLTRFGTRDYPLPASGGRISPTQSGTEDRTIAKEPTIEDIIFDEDEEELDDEMEDYDESDHNDQVHGPIKED